MVGYGSADIVTRWCIRPAYTPKGAKKVCSVRQRNAGNDAAVNLFAFIAMVLDDLVWIRDGLPLWYKLRRALEGAQQPKCTQMATFCFTALDSYRRNGRALITDEYGEYYPPRVILNTHLGAQVYPTDVLATAFGNMTF